MDNVLEVMSGIRDGRLVSHIINIISHFILNENEKKYYNDLIYIFKPTTVKSTTMFRFHEDRKQQRTEIWDRPNGKNENEKFAV